MRDPTLYTEAMQPPNLTSPQLTDENHRELATARLAYRKVRRAISMAQFDAWTIGVIAGFSFLYGVLFRDLTSIVVGMVLVVNAWLELRGAQQIRQLDVKAIRLLGFNQLAIAGLILLYVAWMIILQLTGHSDLAILSTALSQIGITAQQINVAVVGFYLLVLAIGVASTGGMSRYYFTRLKHLESYLRQTPAWIINMQKAGVITL